MNCKGVVSDKDYGVYLWVQTLCMGFLVVSHFLASPCCYHRASEYDHFQHYLYCDQGFDNVHLFALFPLPFFPIPFPVFFLLLFLSFHLFLHDNSHRVWSRGLRAADGRHIVDNVYDQSHEVFYIRQPRLSNSHWTTDCLSHFRKKG